MAREKAKIKRSTLCNGYKMGGIKNVDLRNKAISMQCSWVKRLFEDDFHDWKILPLFLIDKHLGKNFKFHNNLDISNDVLSKRLTVSLYIFLFFWQKLELYWSIV